jgi:hypothetical protein
MLGGFDPRLNRPHQVLTPLFVARLLIILCVISTPKVLPDDPELPIACNSAARSPRQRSNHVNENAKTMMVPRTRSRFKRTGFALPTACVRWG